MRLVEDAARDVQKVRDPFPENVIGGEAGPDQEGPIDPIDTSVRIGGQVAAWRVLKQILQAVRRATVGGHQTKASMAAMTSPGADKLGQWPVALRTTNSLFGIWACTYSPTERGAMASSEHCITRVRTSTRGRSARLSLLAATVANALSISEAVPLNPFAS